MNPFDPAAQAALFDQDEMLQQQLAQALALRGPGRQWATPGGAIAGGIGDLIRNITSAASEWQTRDRMDANRAAKTGGRNAYAEALRAWQGAKPAEIPETLRRPGYDPQAVFEQEQMQQGEQLGRMGLMSGDPMLAPVGQQVLTQAQSAPRRGLEMAMGRQKLAAGQAELDNDNAPANPVYVQLAQKFGTQLPPGATNRQAKEVLGLAERAYAADQRAQELRINREAMRGAREDAREAKRTEAETKRAEAASELDAVGWTRPAGGPKIKREEAASFRDANAAADDILRNASRYRQLIDTHGSELWGEAAGDMDTLATDMLLKMKDLAKLGVLSQSDESLLNKLIPRATGMAGATTQKTVLLSKVDQFAKQVAQKLETRAKSLGYAREGAQEAPAGAKKVRDPKTGRTGTWDGKSPLPPGVEVLP